VLVAISAGGQTLHRESLDGAAWQFRQAGGNGGNGLPADPQEWLPATVPGDVHLDLLANKRIPEPFYRDNEKKLQWIENAAWEYRRNVSVDASTLTQQHQVLVFKGIDAAAKVFVNGEQVAAPNNMFREWRIDVTGKLKAGDNELRVYFPSPMGAAQAVANNDPWRAQTHTDPRTYIRKAAYEFGWDWGPRFVTSGIWLPVSLETWNDARIENVFVEQPSVSATVAHLNVQTEVESQKVQTAHVSLVYGLNGVMKHMDEDVLLAAGVNKLALPVNIDHPELWWPNGYGAQPLYSFTVKVTAGGKLADSVDTHAGLRSIVLRRDQDQWGRSFEFVVNGVPVFAKGAAVIPFDSFPSRVTTAQYRRILESAHDTNMNMIRQWGGGYYETDEFYDECDRLGLMVWQDLMFGNDWQPGTYDFKQEIAREATYQMHRLRNHPSIALWGGNNETEQRRDLEGRGELPAPVRARMLQDYLTEFQGVLAVAAATNDPEVPYWSSSPSADFEDLHYGYESGDNHDWTVWHGHLDYSAYNEHGWRFVSEFGFESMPEMNTLESFTKPDDLANIWTPLLALRQKSPPGNFTLDNYVKRYYGTAKDFPSFVYATQVLQAEAITAGVEGWRRSRPRTMGTLFWQLNDCWPALSWSSIDYYGHWKALQYAARRFYAPVIVSPVEKNGGLSVYVVSDHTAPEQAELSIRLMKFDGTIVKQWEKQITVQPLASAVALTIPKAELLSANTQASDVVVVAELRESGTLISQKLSYLAPTKMLKLPLPQIGSTVTQTPDGFDVTLTSPVLARSVYLSFGKNDVDYSDNYVDLLPGLPATIHVKGSATLDALKDSLRTQSLADAFSSAGTAPVNEAQRQHRFRRRTLALLALAGLFVVGVVYGLFRRRKVLAP
jgi:beta-mannosidase